jgi:peptidyl-prolyl cis-trans isomerase D
MFNLFRSRAKSVRYLMGAVLLVIAASMVWFLIPGGGMGGFGGNPNVIATVGKEQITTQDLQRAIDNITRGRSLPKGMLAMYVPSIIEQMIGTKAMAYEARHLGMQVSDNELAAAIREQFTAALGRSFDMQTYEQILAQQNLTPQEFEREQREAMLAAKLEHVEAQSALVTDQEARAEYMRRNLKIGLDYVEFQAKSFVPKVDQSPAKVKAYFDKHRSEFRIPDQRDAALIGGASADLVQGEQISDAQLKQTYQENIDSYRFPQRVKVRHILIKFSGTSPQDEAKAKTKAEMVLQKLQHGGDFAKLAKQYSEDPGSASKGGEIGWIERGQTVKNFEDTAFSMNAGQTSGLVKTQYGYHIIQVQAKQAAHTESFEEAKPTLLLQAKKQAAADDLEKAIDAAHAEITNNPAQAEAIAKKHHLKYYALNNVTNASTLPEVNGAPSMINAIFAAKAGGVTEVVTLDTQGKAAFAAVRKISPAHNAEYKQVQQQVLQKYVAAESAKLAKEAADQAAARARKGESLKAIAKEAHLQVKTASPFTINGAVEGMGSATLIASAFHDKEDAIVGPVSAQDSQFVCQITQKIPADMSKFETSKDSIVQDLTSQQQNVQGPLFRDSVVAYLTQHGKVRIDADNYKRVLDSYKNS